MNFSDPSKQWNNPLLQNFNTYMNNNPTPFQNNQLLNQNIHAMGAINDQLKQTPKTNQSRYRSGKNIFDEMFKPEETKGDNRDITKHYKEREKNYAQKIEPENIPYKIIIKDKPAPKKVKTGNDLMVHKSTLLDSDIKKFELDLAQKKQEKKKINQELAINFSDDKRDVHQENFDIDGTYIKNASYTSNTFNENKEDYVEFYRKCQREAEEGKEMCDQIINKLLDTGLIKTEELPTEIINVSPIETNFNVKSDEILELSSNKSQTLNIEKPVKSIKVIPRKETIDDLLSKRRI